MGINDYIKVGSRMKELRKINKINSKDMADMLMLSKSTYANYEADRREPPISVIKQFCSVLNIEIGDLLGNYDPRTGEYLGSSEKVKLNECYDSLNMDGKLEAVKRVEELTYIEKYIRKDDDGNNE